MSKGKFEAGNNGKTTVRKTADPFAVKDKPKPKPKSGGSFAAKTPAESGFASKLWPILAVVAGVAVIGFLLIVTLWNLKDRSRSLAATEE